MKGEFDSSVYVPLTAFGSGYSLNKRSASYPTSPGTLSPSLNPVPAYTQCPLFVTTYGTPSIVLGTMLTYWTPTNVCSGRLSTGSRHGTVFRLRSVIGSRLAFL